MRIWCVDCNAVREMGVHGECATCGSGATDILERNAPFIMMESTAKGSADYEVKELEKLWKRGDS